MLDNMIDIDGDEVFKRLKGLTASEASKIYIDAINEIANEANCICTVEDLIEYGNSKLKPYGWDLDMILFRR